MADGGSTVGGRIKYVRKQLEMRQAEFAEALGTNQSHVSGLECCKHNPSKILLLLISKNWNVDLAWIETGKGEPFARPETSGLEALAGRLNVDGLDVGSIKRLEDACVRLETTTAMNEIGGLSPAQLGCLAGLTTEICRTLEDTLARTARGVSQLLRRRIKDFRDCDWEKQGKKNVRT